MTIDPIVFWLLLALGAIAAYKVVAPALWKFCVLVFRTVHMLFLGHKNHMPMGECWIYLPDTMLKVWRANFYTTYSYNEVFFYDFRKRKFLSQITDGQQWLNDLALMLRTGANGFSLSVNVARPPEGIAALDEPDTYETVPVDAYIKPTKFVDDGADEIAVHPVFVIAQVEGADGQLANDMKSLANVLAYFRPEVKAIIVQSDNDTIEYLTHVRGYPVHHNDVPSRMYKIEDFF